MSTASEVWAWFLWLSVSLIAYMNLRIQSDSEGTC